MFIRTLLEWVRDSPSDRSCRQPPLPLNRAYNEAVDQINGDLSKELDRAGFLRCYSALASGSSGSTVA